MKTLKDIEVLEGVKVLVRADFNVPIRNSEVSDDFRIKSALPTFEFLKSRGAKTIVISHLEAMDGGNGSLAPVGEYLNKAGFPNVFVKDYKQAYEIIENQENGSLVLLENLRFFEGEKKNDPKFAKELASLADIYVNEAFSACHREHASIVAVPRLLPSYAGLQLEKEVANLSKAFDPSHPFLFILGGAKFETKLPLLKKFLDEADNVFVGGALATDFYKLLGYEIGKSKTSKEGIDLSPYLDNKKLMIPKDILNQDKTVKNADSLSKEDVIMDAGPEAMKELGEKVRGAKFILWNGPLGLYEDGYKGATLELAKLISEATGRGAESIVGGGDTLAAIASLGIQEKFTFLSTGGGAMLDFLANGTLPGIKALG